MKLKLLYDSKVSQFDTPVNAGFDSVQQALQEIERRGDSVQMVDTSRLSEEQVGTLYLDAVAASVLKKYRIRQVFGTKRHSGSFFGREVPALLVYGRSETVPEQVYPHEEFGRAISIKEYLDRTATA